ncbi:MAG: response regulator transcription factor [Actinobacteria bacterium]|nr:response regulator transcription factor [Actinomycetota bacterium]
MTDPINVLVIDDDQSIVEMIKMGLEMDNMRVFGAADGGEGIEVLASESIDVVILDIMMPRVDGWMALMEIRNNPDTAGIPVIMLSAKTQDLAKILAFKQGVQQYVTKPFSVLELSARVESLAKSRRIKPSQTTSTDGDFRKLAVRKGGRIALLAIEDIVLLSARNKSTYAHTFENQYLVDMTLTELETRLAKENFVRAHRAFMINLDKVKEILREEGAYVVVVGDRDETRIPVSRRQTRAFREAVGI